MVRHYDFRDRRGLTLLLLILIAVLDGVVGGLLRLLLLLLLLLAIGTSRLTRAARIACDSAVWTYPVSVDS